MKRVMMYSHDTFGLGNIRRMLTIAKDLVDNDPELSVLIVSGSPMLHAFRIPPRIDYLKLPCLSRTIDGQYVVKYLDLSYAETIRLRANLFASALLDFDPDLLIVDKKPLGVGNELEAALDLIRRRGKSTKLVLLLRDILDSADTTRTVWRKNGYFEAIKQYYDQVLVVGSATVFDLASEYDFPEEICNKVRYCGYLRRERSTQASALRELYVPEGKSMTLVTPGGGEDGFRLIAAYLDALAVLPEQVRPHSVVVCGPEMVNTHRTSVTQSAAARSAEVTVLEFAEDMMGLMEAADLVVSMSGYNTVCELLTLKKRAILVPRVKPVQEQCIRAERLAHMGLATMILPDALTPLTLAKALTEELRQANVYRRGLYQIDLHGLTRVRDYVNQLIAPKAAAAPALDNTLTAVASS